MNEERLKDILDEYDEHRKPFDEYRERRRKELSRASLRGVVNQLIELEVRVMLLENRKIGR